MLECSISTSSATLNFVNGIFRRIKFQYFDLSLIKYIKRKTRILLIIAHYIFNWKRDKKKKKVCGEEERHLLRDRLSSVERSVENKNANKISKETYVKLKKIGDATNKGNIMEKTSSDTD